MSECIALLLSALVWQNVLGLDVVFFLERSAQTQPALKALQTSAAKLFATIDGRTKERLNFVTYSFTSYGALEEFGESEVPEEVLTKLSSVHQAPIDNCVDTCCCSTGFANYFGQIVYRHPGAVILAINDCLTPPSDDEVFDLGNQIRLTYTTVYVLRLADSYCHSYGSEKDNMGMTNFEFFINSASVTDLLPVVGLHALGMLVTYQYATGCKNVNLPIPFWFGPTQGAGVLFAMGISKDGISIRDPNDKPYTRNRVDYLKDPNGPQFTVWYADCEKGWHFYNGFCYFVDGRPTSFEKAGIECQKKGATLLSEFDDSVLPFWSADELFEGHEVETDRDSSTYWIALADQKSPENFPLASPQGSIQFGTGQLLALGTRRATRNSHWCPMHYCEPSPRQAMDRQPLHRAFALRMCASQIQLQHAGL